MSTKVEYLEPCTALVKPIETEAQARKALDDLAWRCGQETVLYLRRMYPEAEKACSGTFELSLRNTIRNRINSEMWPLVKNMAKIAGEVKNAGN